METKSTGIHVGDEISLSKYFKIVFQKNTQVTQFTGHVFII